MTKLNNSFYRPQRTNFEEYDAICAKLRDDLNVILKKEATQDEAESYARELIALGHKFETHPGVLLWELEKPREGCSEGQIAYVGAPTRTVMAILVNVKLNYPEAARNIDGFDYAVWCAMRGAAACGFSGHGYDSERYLVDTMSELVEWNVPKFLEEFMQDDFADKFRRARFKVAEISRATSLNWWHDEKVIAKAKETNAKLRNIRKTEIMKRVSACKSHIKAL